MHMNHLYAGNCTALLQSEELRVLNTPSAHSEVVHKTITAIQSTTNGGSPKGDLDHAWAQSLSPLSTRTLGALLTLFSGYGWVEGVWVAEALRQWSHMAI